MSSDAESEVKFLFNVHILFFKNGRRREANLSIFDSFVLFWLKIASIRALYFLKISAVNL